MSDEPPRGHATRAVVAGILLVLLGYAVIRRLFNPAYVSDPPPLEAVRSAEVEDRFDPNEAEWQTFAALPGIGESKARSIVAYREQYHQQHPGERAFAKLEDLLRIRGVGVTMLTQMQPYLRFPQPATQQVPATLP